jgi:hypothetical protein
MHNAAGVLEVSMPISRVDLSEHAAELIYERFQRNPAVLVCLKARDHVCDCLKVLLGHSKVIIAHLWGLRQGSIQGLAK